MTAKEIGERGEQLALRHYEEHGYRLCEANFRTRQGEVDLILEKGGMLVFAEVKARTGKPVARPREWVDGRKQRRITAAALGYLNLKKISEPIMRFDVVEIILDEAGEAVSLECIEGAFTA